MKAGDIIQLNNNPHGQTYLIIMAVVDNYVMCRYPRCMPFCLPLKNFEQKFMQQQHTASVIKTHGVVLNDVEYITNAGW